MPLVPLGLDFAYPAEFQNLCVVRARVLHRISYGVYAVEIASPTDGVQRRRYGNERRLRKQEVINLATTFSTISLAASAS